MTDEPEQTEDDDPYEAAWELAIPFTLVESNGGPYPDEAYFMGTVEGMIMTRLQVAKAIGATQLRYAVPPEMTHQLDLHAMHDGFTTNTEEIADNPDWVWMTFTVKEDND